MDLGALLFLLVGFLAPGAAIIPRPALRTLGSLHLPANPTSRPAIANNYSVLYFEQKVRTGEGGGRFTVPGPTARGHAHAL